MDQVAAIGSVETQEPPTALDRDALIHKVRLRLVPAGVAQPGSKQLAATCREHVNNKRCQTVLGRQRRP
jgi:hypothetical protein